MKILRFNDDRIAVLKDGDRAVDVIGIVNSMKTSEIKFMSSVAAALALVAVLISRAFVSNGDAAQNAPRSNTLAGMQMGQAPWIAEITHLLDRLNAIHLPALPAEGNMLHIHQHLDIIVNGTAVTVPADIGINRAALFISPIHTHDESGVIHVESDEFRDYTLGDFFDIWGVRFIKDCVGGYCSKGTSMLKVFSEGKPVAGDPRRLVLRSHQEIAVIYGPPAAFKSVPSSYRFSPGS